MKLIAFYAPAVLALMMTATPAFGQEDGFNPFGGSDAVTRKTRTPP